MHPLIQKRVKKKAEETQFAYLVSLRKAAFEEFSRVLLCGRCLRHLEAFPSGGQSMYGGESSPMGAAYYVPHPLMYTRLCSVFLQSTQYTYKCHLQYSSLLFLEYMIKWTQVLHLQHRESGEAVWEEGLRCYPVAPHLLLNKIPPHFSLLCAVFFIHVLIILRDGQVLFHRCVCLTRCHHWEDKDEKGSHSYYTFQGLTIDILDPT